MILELIVLEICVSYSLATMERHQKERILTKWREGKMSMEELLLLKRSRWFQQYMRFTKENPLTKKLQ